jgi:hypothetical protein
MSSETQKQSKTRDSFVRALAAYDRNADNHKKIYKDLAEE